MQETQILTQPAKSPNGRSASVDLHQSCSSKQHELEKWDEKTQGLLPQLRDLRTGLSGGSYALFEIQIVLQTLQIPE